MKFMRKTLLSVILITSLFLMQFTAFAYEPSFWAKENVDEAIKLSIISEEFDKKPFDSDMSRIDFINVAVNLYATITAEDVCTNPKNPFKDTDDMFSNMAYYAGIISGDGEGHFFPNNTLTRQEMCKIVADVLGAANVLGVYNPSDNVFGGITDEKEIAPWAKNHVAFMVENELMAGYEDGAFHPNDNVTREQAAILAHRCYIKYCKDIDGTINTSVVPWKDGAGNTIYSLVKKVSSPYGTTVALRDADNKDYNNESGGDKSEQIKNDELNSVPDGSAGFAPSGTPLQAPNEDGLYKLKSYSETLATGEAAEKEERIFGKAGKYTSMEEAEENIVEVTVPVWKLDNDGNLYESTLTFKINKKLEEDVQAIFKEIFDSPQKPPLKDAAGYAWRSSMSSGVLSDHNYGTAIDLNYRENFTVYKNGTKIGSFYDPENSVYSFSQTGVVIQTFAKYGWLWGGNAWVSGTKDYMHFTYLGK